MHYSFTSPLPHLLKSYFLHPRLFIYFVWTLLFVPLNSTSLFLFSQQQNNTQAHEASTIRLIKTPPIKHRRINLKI